MSEGSRPSLSANHAGRRRCRRLAVLPRLDSPKDILFHDEPYAACRGDARGCRRLNPYGTQATASIITVASGSWNGALTSFTATHGGDSGTALRRAAWTKNPSDGAVT